MLNRRLVHGTHPPKMGTISVRYDTGNMGTQFRYGYAIRVCAIYGYAIRVRTIYGYWHDIRVRTIYGTHIRVRAI